MKLLKVLTLLGILSVSLSTNGFSMEQPDDGNNAKGKIIGVVSDKVNSETLVGLAVIVEGTTIASPTNIDGRYELRLAPGKYSIVFRYIGYQTKTISDVIVKAGEVTNLNVLMEDNAVLTNEVVISASFKQESISALYSIQKNNIAISSGISAELIKRSPDRNTSDVLKRVSGASIQNNQFVVIRGLADRYNAATLNNSPLVSSEPDRKAFAFDIISSNMLDNIIINKTASPDLPGDFAGGVVQIYTKDIPDVNFLDVQAGTSINSISTFKGFVTNPTQGGNRFLGLADPNRKFATGLSRADISALSRTGSDIDALFDVTESFNSTSNNTQQTTNAFPNSQMQVTYGLNKGVKKGNFGVIVALSHRNSQTFSQQFRRNYDVSGDYFQYFDDNYTTNTSTGGLANLSYVTKKLKVSSKNLFNNIYNENLVNRTGQRIVDRNNVELSINELTVRTMQNSQLDAEYIVNDSGVKLTGNLNYARLHRDQPDMRQVYYQSDFYDPEDPSKDLSPTYNSRDSRRVFSKLEEEVKGGFFSMYIPYEIQKAKQGIKVGALTQSRDRGFDARFLFYEIDAFSPFKDSVKALPIQDIWGSNLDRNDFFISSFGDTIYNHYLLKDATNNSDAYTATSGLAAVYFLSENKLFSRLKLSWGARVESFNQQLKATDNSGEAIEGNNNNIDVLPSSNLTVQLTEKSNLRFSVSRTVSRPEFRELAPFSFYDYVSQIEVIGNSALQRSINNNYDARYEFYPSSTESFTFTGFYKKFFNPIEQVLNSSSSPDRQLVSYNNAKDAHVYGLELEARKKLESFTQHKILKHITVFGNLTYVRSVVNSMAIDTTQGGSQMVEFKRALQGQSPYLMNAGLQYDFKDAGLSISALYNRIGPRIAYVGLQSINEERFDNDIYENGRDVIDVQLSKELLKGKAQLKFNIRDLLSQNTVLYQNAQESNKIKNHQKEFDALKDERLRSINLGSTYSISFTYKLGLDKK